jgi:hypothetical protein
VEASGGGGGVMNLQDFFAVVVRLADNIREKLSVLLNFRIIWLVHRVLLRDANNNKKNRDYEN